VAAGPLVRVISGLTGVHDLDDPALARLTREARCETLVGLAVGNLRAGRPVGIANWNPIAVVRQEKRVHKVRAFIGRGSIE